MIYLFTYELAYSIDNIDIVTCLIKYFYLNSNFIVMFMNFIDIVTVYEFDWESAETI
jgi:hypothetical protein